MLYCRLVRTNLNQRVRFFSVENCHWAWVMTKLAKLVPCLHVVQAVLQDFQTCVWSDRTGPKTHIVTKSIVKIYVYRIFSTSDLRPCTVCHKSLRSSLRKAYPETSPVLWTDVEARRLKDFPWRFSNDCIIVMIEFWGNLCSSYFGFTCRWDSNPPRCQSKIKHCQIV